MNALEQRLLELTAYAATPPDELVLPHAVYDQLKRQYDDEREAAQKRVDRYRHPDAPRIPDDAPTVFTFNDCRLIRDETDDRTTL